MPVAEQKAYLHRTMNTQSILENTLVWDNHSCMPLRPADTDFLPQLERMRSSHVDIVSLNIGFGPISMEQHFRVLASFRKWISGQPDKYMLIDSVSDIDKARGSRKLGILFDIEGLAPFDDGDHGMVSTFYDLGVRWALIAYNKNNKSGGGCMDDDGGLTSFGLSIIREMQRVGMVVCCSHTGHKTAHDVLSAADGPVIFSHSNASTLYKHERNIPDDLIVDCAQTGGVVGINGIGAFHDESLNLADSIIQHIDHISQLVGPMHVGLGLDYVFDQQELQEYLAKMRDTFPNDDSFDKQLRLAPPEMIADITEGLVKRGYDHDALSKILGGNWKRVAELAKVISDNCRRADNEIAIGSRNHKKRQRKDDCFHQGCTHVGTFISNPFPALLDG